MTDAGPGLDTGCTFNTDPNHPLIIDVLVDRAVGDVDGNGFLVNPAPLIAEGVIPATVEIIVPAFDVDVNGSPPPESDEIVLNGESLGFLTGDNNIWKLNAFNVPIGKIKFPVPPPPNSCPAPAVNRVQVNIDTLSTGRWCTAIDWVALVIPIKPKTAFKLEPTAGNRIRENTGSATIDTIYEQSFDANCALTTDIGPYDEYPFSGPASNTARLHATLEMCPRNDQCTPEVKAEWKIGGTSLKGVTTWSGDEGDIELTMPRDVGAYDAEITFTIDGKDYPAINRKLFVTLKSPTAQVDPPRRTWYEKATSWASGQRQERQVLSSLLGGLYSFGGGNWRYIDDGSCGWENLVADPITCDFGNCFIFSNVFENMAGTLGISGLSAVTPLGTLSRGFLTNAAPSLDPAFPGSAQEVGSSTYDRYVFGSHSLRRKSRYYDATFNGIYNSETAFITANANGGRGSDADGRYSETTEGWKIYGRPGTSFYTWYDYDYKPPPPVTAPLVALPMFASLVNKAMTTDIEFTGNVTFDLPDDDLDGLAEALTAEVEVQLNSAGEYLILGLLEKGGGLIANRPRWESMQEVRATLDEISGTYTVTLQFSGEQIFRSGEDGPYELGLEGIAADGFTTATLATPAYDRTLFGEIYARFTGVSEAAVDADVDGELDYVEATLDLESRLPADFRLQGSLDKDGETVVDAGAAASVGAGASQVTLQFDGGTIRRSGVDGPYDGTVNLIDAAGHTIDSITFTTNPYSAGSFSVLITPQAPYSDQGVDTNANGLFDLLRIGFGAEFEEAGSYLLTGVLHAAGSPSVVYSDLEVAVAAGATSLVLDFPGPVINDLELDGPYTVEVRVRAPGTLEELDAALLPFSTAAYAFTDFDPFGATDLPIVLTGNSSDQGVDTDANGLFDELHVDVEVGLAQADFYEWGARLVDSNGTEIGFYTRRASLPAGIVDLHFVFDGEQIGTNGVDGPYFLKGLLIFGSSGVNLVKIDVAETQPYLAREFEGVDGVPPQIEVAAESMVLWPVNHKLHEVAVTDFVVAVTDDQDSTVSLDDVVITEVTSDEPVDDTGDGATEDDIVIASDCRSVMLRAERAGGGNGRVYTIHVAAADATGNVGTAIYTVIVPHDSSGQSVIDDGPDHGVGGCSP